MIQSLKQENNIACIFIKQEFVKKTIFFSKKETVLKYITFGN